MDADHASRMDALEQELQRIARRLARLEHESAAPPSEDSATRSDTEGAPHTPADAEADAAAPPPPLHAAPGHGAAPADATRGADPFWAHTALQHELPEPGGVVFAGSVTTPAGHVDYQWARPTEHLLDGDWAEHAEAIGALGHSLRLAILQRLCAGEHTVAQLVEELELASTGVAYHHLGALQQGGWVRTPRRGSWQIPATRLIPLMTILIAAEKS